MPRIISLYIIHNDVCKNNICTQLYVDLSLLAYESTPLGRRQYMSSYTRYTHAHQAVPHAEHMEMAKLEALATWCPPPIRSRQQTK